MTTRTFRIEHARDGWVATDQLDGRGPPLVYLHGLSSTRFGEKSTALFELAATLGMPAYRFDFRGHGESSGHLFSTTLTELCADARAVLDRSGPATLVGSSLGGLVGAWTAALHPELVSGLTLLAPAFDFLRRVQPHIGPDGSAVLPSEWSGEIRLGPGVIDDLERHDEALLPSRLAAPTLIVHGALDTTVPVAASRAVFDAIPHDRKEMWVLPHGDHTLVGSFPEILDRIARFHDLTRPPGRPETC